MSANSAAVGRSSASSGYTYASSLPTQRIDPGGTLDTSDYSNGCGAPGTAYCIDDGGNGVGGGGFGIYTIDGITPASACFISCFSGVS